MSDGNGTRVTAFAVDRPDDPGVHVIKDDYCLITDGDCYVAGIQAYPAAGTHVITVKGLKAGCE